jgi:hypothetical protein
MANGVYTDHGIYLPNYEDSGEDEKALFDAGMIALDTLIGDIIAAAVTVTGNQTIAGVKTFTSFPVLPSSSPSTDYQAATKKYVDDRTQPAQALIPSGSKMAFYQGTAPTGWTQDTSVNDAVIRVVSGTGGGNGGSWTLSGLSIGDHTLTVNEIPAHNHYYGHGMNVAGWIGYTSGYGGAIGQGYYTDNAGGGAGHSHPFTADGSWRPKYIDCIICIKN